MKYFQIEQDKSIQDTPWIVEWQHKFPYKRYDKNSFYHIPKRTLLKVKPNDNLFFTDFITFPFIIFSKKFKEVVSLYNNNIVYKELVLMDFEHRFNGHYYLGMLPEISCLTSKSEFNLDKSVCRKIVIDSSMVENKSVFLLGGLKSDYLIIRMDLAESLLRRDISGIKLHEIELEESEINEQKIF